ncbi:hypothetical protein [Clostridium akagii]|uniref:hypothetical protein n=1 Tax=Clostridium akagii TaxID=91623 RepID=UPI000AAB3291|nr:hypothetical protein [Clostridium akagii]
MGKQLKSSTNNQWASQNIKPPVTPNNSSKKEKTATDNQWVSTSKNNSSEK